MDVDREKVIKGFTCCDGATVHLGHCQEDCPYFGESERAEKCVEKLHSDALSLLKAQDPHVMTAEELEDALDTVVWIERADMKENSSDQYALLVSYSRKYEYFYLQHIQNEHATPYKYKSINRSINGGWRPWNIRPTDEQREETPWKE